MFKAKLIESENYYKLRSKQVLLALLLALPVAFIFNTYQISIWLTIVMIGVYIAISIVIYRNQKLLTSLMGNKLIEIDEEEIRIKSKKGMQLEAFKLAEIEKVILKEDYSMPQETMKEIGRELSGQVKRNYLILQRDDQSRKLDFEIDSYFMINQLNKISGNWIERGFNIERINHE